MNTLEKQQQELRKVATALYKLSWISIKTGFVHDIEKTTTEIFSITKELEKYLDIDDITLLIKKPIK